MMLISSRLQRNKFLHQYSITIYKEGVKMFKKFKVLVLTVVVMSLFFATANVCAAGKSNSVNISINGENTNFKIEFVSGRTMVPLKDIALKLDAEADLYRTTGEIWVKKSEYSLDMLLGKDKIVINGHEKYMDVAPYIKDGVVFVPVRFVCENLGYDVDYIGSSKTIVISSAKLNPISFINVRETSMGNVELDIQYPQIKRLENPKVQDKINDAIKNYIDVFKEEIKDFDNEVLELRNYGFRWNYQACVNYDLEYNKNGILSIVFTDYTYTGGAHGLSRKESFTFNLENGEEYSLDGIFKEGVDYIAKLDNGIKEKIDALPWNEAYNFESIRNIDNQLDYFYLSKEGSLVVYFQHYEIGPYAMGMPEFKFPPGELKELLNDNIISSLGS
jgi:hypothetical protein